MAKLIFVFGGVISGLGKGICTASIGALLKARGFKVSALKIDPYLNVDPGVLGPLEHGEVFVTEDGLETDLDLGHYERFLNQSLGRLSNITSGKIYQKIIEQERDGFYEGRTVQIIPHFTNEVREYIDRARRIDADFVICEIGGTVGDIESDPFLFAICEYISENPGETLVVHVTYIPYLVLSKEFKTKPTQSSVRTLRSKGIRPQIIILRCPKKVPVGITNKVADFCGLARERVVPLRNLREIYACPIELRRFKIDEVILKHFKLKGERVKLDPWRQFVAKLRGKQGRKILTIALVGKYINYLDSYKSILEAIKISSAYTDCEVRLKMIDSEKLTDRRYLSQTLEPSKVDGVIILPGFGYRGWEGKIAAASYLLKEEIPTLGICFGFQAMIIAQARLMGITDANSAEFLEECSEQTSVLDLVKGSSPKLSGASLRLGSGRISLKKGSTISRLYGGLNEISERHRHRYNVAPKFVKKLERDGFNLSGISVETDLFECCEVSKHNFFIGVQFHPEFHSRPLDPHPLFNSFLMSAKRFFEDKERG